MNNEYHPADRPIPSEKFLKHVGERAMRATVEDTRIQKRTPERHEGIVDRRNYNAAIEFVNLALKHIKAGNPVHAKGALAAVKEYLGKPFSETPKPFDDL